MHLAVTLGRSDADDVLAVQLVGDGGDGGAEVLSEADLRLACKADLQGLYIRTYTR